MTRAGRAARALNLPLRALRVYEIHPARRLSTSFHGFDNQYLRIDSRVIADKFVAQGAFGET